MGVIAKGIPRGCQGLFTPVSLGYPLSVFNKNSTLKATHWLRTRKPRKDSVGKKQEHKARRYVGDSQSRVHAPWFALDETFGPCQ